MLELLVIIFAVLSASKKWQAYTPDHNPNKLKIYEEGACYLTNTFYFDKYENGKYYGSTGGCRILRESEQSNPTYTLTSLPEYAAVLYYYERNKCDLVEGKPTEVLLLSECKEGRKYWVEDNMVYFGDCEKQKISDKNEMNKCIHLIQTQSEMYTSSAKSSLFLLSFLFFVLLI
ncbi:hypothetical protein EIN_155250 [Entamoeba invadens IP1]|uniref:Uncharacterized protein n=1 Tax=Entamoeba invadens IP1 TaxID=370355 RepID=A0A0A1UCN5_ENTIV|nr:hypothetical protein EIN_155250 [Entamoeba invadens IP1]ELP91418.1 hypothetical protein EIN_155250 [Entamoeba invadens IP1]|eukprot:XP_004258189.1 hypothetical protein EIN_155250 [Entamoeba invadens IP1]